jgi:Ca2+-binding EF-hand superfamily protein
MFKSFLDEELLKMVRDVSEDPIYDTIEFNEFLQLVSKQKRSGTTHDSLTDAFRYLTELFKRPKCDQIKAKHIF